MDIYPVDVSLLPGNPKDVEMVDLELEEVAYLENREPGQMLEGDHRGESVYNWTL